MATIKVFTSDGVKELKCFDTLDDVPFIEDDDIEEEEIVESAAADDRVDF